MNDENKRARIPFGYCVVEGQVVPENEECQKLQLLYGYYLQGCSLKTCLQLAGVKRSIGWLRSVFDNELYLGNDDYPQLISPELWNRGHGEAIKRGKNNIGKKKEMLRQKPVPVETSFVYKRRKNSMDTASPVQIAIQMYRSIQPRGTKNTVRKK